jgi:hypothetical protein
MPDAARKALVPVPGLRAVEEVLKKFQDEK